MDNFHVYLHRIAMSGTTEASQIVVYPITVVMHSFDTVFPRFGAPGHLLIFKVFRDALNQAEVLTQTGALTKTRHNLQLAIFRMVTLKSFDLILSCCHAFLL